MSCGNISNECTQAVVLFWDCTYMDVSYSFIKSFDSDSRFWLVRDVSVLNSTRNIYTYGVFDVLLKSLIIPIEYTEISFKDNVFLCRPYKKPKVAYNLDGYML